tara:strand:- start:2151 stop:4667 length:2517 start_codon:yes stop_codon:yes gene_type:complete
MPVVTQLTPNFLGGVSKQNDDKKLEGQVSECINGYPDATYGLLKRPGMKFTDHLKKQNGTAFTKTELDNATWFFIDRSSAQSYVGAIKGTNIYVWTNTGTWCTVTAPGGGAIATSYLTGTNEDDYHFRSIQDTTIITNKTVTTTMQAAGTFVASSVATLKLLTLVDTFEYTVNIQGVEAKVTAQSSTTFDDMLLYDSGSVNTNNHLIDKIKSVIEAQHTASNSDFDGIWYLEGYNNSIVIKRGTGSNAVVTDYSAVTGTPVGFTIDAKGGLNNNALEAFEDDVTEVSKLPLESFTGHNVKILNSDSAEDDYHVKFIAYDTNLNRGRGFWKETIARDASPGLLATSMPHELANTGPTTFTFGPIAWKDRFAGDDTTSPIPSFIGNKITSTFFYNNRFGILADDNIILGVANDPYNFFVKSALTQIDSDPIDLSVASVRPVKLFSVLPSPQGLTLFGERQQFIVFSPDTSILTPSTTIIRSISNYEMDRNIEPRDVGTTAVFVSKVSSYSKVFSLQLRGDEENPQVVDISQQVLEWIPNTVDDLIVSPQNSLSILVDKHSSYMYLFRYYNDGEKNQFQAWTKWQVNGTIQSAYILNDDVTLIIQHEDEYTLQTITLDEIPTGEVTANASSVSGSPCLDFACRPKHNGGGTAVSYDAVNDVTKVYVPFKPITEKDSTVLIGKPGAEEGTALEGKPKYDGSYYYFEVQKDQSNLADGIIVGYPFNFEVVLPKLYYRRDAVTTDYTAVTTIARIKLSANRNGALTFKTKLNSTQEWIALKSVTVSDNYEASTNPVKPEYIFTVPIHQRNTNFELKVTSDFPYPVSLVSMMWEGNYSPRFYKRT